LFTVVLAMLAAPLHLPAASCILSNAPSPKACKMDCCANKTCCAVSEENTGLASQPFAQSGVQKQQIVALVATAPASFLAQSIPLDRLAWASVPVRTHSPPPLAANCIRLI
jgi:hypothetical protein